MQRTAWQRSTYSSRTRALAGKQEKVTGGLRVLPPSPSKGDDKGVQHRPLNEKRQKGINYPRSWLKHSPLAHSGPEHSTLRRCSRLQPPSSWGWGALRGRTKVVVLRGGSIGKSEGLRLTEPATGCHADVHGRSQGHIRLAASDLTCGGASECKVQVVQHRTFPAPLGERWRVCVFVSPALRHCLPVYKLRALRFCVY